MARSISVRHTVSPICSSSSRSLPRPRPRSRPWCSAQRPASQRRLRRHRRSRRPRRPAPLPLRSPRREVESLADFGAVPRGPLGPILYALHVQARRKELALAAEDATGHRKSSELARDETLAALGRAVVERRDELDTAKVSDALEAARGALDEAGERSSTLGREAEERALRRGELDAALAAARKEIGPWRDRETRLRTQLEIRETDLARIRARLERIVIELRNIRADPARPPDATRLAMLEADREARAQEVRVAEQPVLGLTDELAEAKRELAVRLARSAQIEEDLRELDRHERHGASKALVSQGVEAQKAQRALVALGAQALQAGLGDAADPKLRARATRAIAAVEEKKRRERLHHLAIDAFDRPTLLKGVAILGAAGVVVAAMILFILLRSIF